MKKVPWGILSGVFAGLVFYLTVGVVAAYLVLNGIAGATSGSVTLFSNWWQTVLFIADVVFGLGFLASIVMFILKAAGKFDQREEKK